MAINPKKQNRLEFKIEEGVQNTEVQELQNVVQKLHELLNLFKKSFCRNRQINAERLLTLIIAL